MKSYLKNGLVVGIIFCVLLVGMDGGLAQENRIEVTHNLGTTSVVKDPRTVVVFDYGILDVLDSIGVKVTGLPQGNLPSHLEKFNDKSYTNVGTLFEPNFELIYELRPDLILISTRTAEQYQELSRIGPTIYLEIDTNDYLGSFKQNLALLGEIFGRTGIIQEEIAEIEQRMADLRQHILSINQNALIVMANDGALSAYGPGSRFGIIHKEFGFSPSDKAITVANHGQNVSFEYLVEVNPDYLLVIDRAATVGGSVLAEQVLDNELIRLTDAYKNGDIIYLNSQVWYTASGGIMGTKLMIEDLLQIFD